MKRFLALVLLVASTGTVVADSVEVRIADEGWSIFFDAPRLSKKQEWNKLDQFSYSASSGRFSISLLVEKALEEGSRNRDAYQYYWSKASQNPTIVKESVSASEILKYVRVEYDIVVNVQGKAIRQKNINYYFAFRDRWVDVHISVLRPVASDQEIFNVFETSLGYGRT